MKDILEQVYSKKDKINQLQREMLELGSQLQKHLIGVEVLYRNEKGLIDSINVLDGEVILEMENDDGNSWHEWISIWELEDVIKKEVK